MRLALEEYKTCYYTVITNMNPAAVLHWYTALRAVYNGLLANNKHQALKNQMNISHVKCF